MLQANRPNDRPPKLDNELHRYWIEKSENLYIIEFFDRHAPYYSTLLDLAAPATREVAAMARQHRAILLELIARDHRGAREALTAHIRAAADRSTLHGTSDPRTQRAEHGTSARIPPRPETPGMRQRPMISTPRIKLALAAIVLPSSLFFSLHVASAQGTKADYERASTLANSTRDKVFKTRVEPHWFADGDMFWYRNDLADDAREFIVVDAVKGKRERGFDHEKLAKKLSEATKSDVKADRLPIERLKSTRKARSSFSALDKGWKYVPKDDSLAEHEAPKGSTEPSQAPQTGAEERAAVRAGRPHRRPILPTANGRPS